MYRCNKHNSYDTHGLLTHGHTILKIILITSSMCFFLKRLKDSRLKNALNVFTMQAGAFTEWGKEDSEGGAST